VILRLAQLNQQLANLVLHLHLLQDGGPVVGCTAEEGGSGSTQRHRQQQQQRRVAAAAAGGRRQRAQGPPGAARGANSCRPHSLITMSPSGPCSSLSMPLGPREVRRMRETAFAA
jgi:hypothetical protein